MKYYAICQLNDDRLGKKYFDFTNGCLVWDFAMLAEGFVDDLINFSIFTEYSSFYSPGARPKPAYHGIVCTK